MNESVLVFLHAVQEWMICKNLWVRDDTFIWQTSLDYMYLEALFVCTQSTRCEILGLAGIMHWSSTASSQAEQVFLFISSSE